jgi:coenzyme F420-reducing hydrogenase gamma subunit
VTLRTIGTHKKAESVDDLVEWLWALRGCPPIKRTVVARCTRQVHGSEPATWFYVEADAHQGVARTRCLACGDARPLLDSADRWTYPPVWSCSTCAQSIAEVAFGISEEGGVATWLAMAVRCVECGEVQGLTDAIVPGVAEESFAASL